MLFTAAESYQRVPWRNGRGVSYVMASDDRDPARWRLSHTTIDADGPFSDYAGFDRTIVALGGSGDVAELTVDGVPHRLRPLEPFAFSGDATTSCRLLAGPTRDFNVATLRSAFAHSVEIVHGLRGGTLDLGPGVTGVRSFVVVLDDGTTAIVVKVIDRG